MRSNYQWHVGGGIAKEEHVSCKIMGAGVIITDSEHISLGIKSFICPTNAHKLL